MFANLFRKKDTTPLPDFKDVTVKLPTVLGIRPGLYLMVVYGIIILAAVYFLFFFRGCVDAGLHYRFESTPLPAGVWIDGKKEGVTPCDILIKEGPHEIAIGRPFYKTVTLKRDVGRYVFSLPFLPGRDYVSVALEVENIDQLASRAFRDFNEWTMVDGFSTEYPYPPLLTEASKSIFAMPDDRAHAALRLLLERSLRSAGQPQPAADWLRALFNVESRGRGLTPGAVFGLLDSAREYIRRYDNLPFFIYSVLPKDQRSEEEKAAAAGKPQPLTRDSFGTTPGFNALAAVYRDYILAFRPRAGALPGGGFSLEGLSFLPVPGGDFVLGKNEKETSILNPEYTHLFPHPVRVSGFYMSRTEVTNDDYRRFLADNPDWRPENARALREKELVDEFYLKDWQDGRPPAGRGAWPVTHVSAYAAEAYCVWLTGKLLRSRSGLEARLPTEAEWEWAAAGGDPARFKTSGSRLKPAEGDSGPAPVGASAGNLFGLQDMAGNVEEICRDWFAKSTYLLSSKRPENNPAAEPEPFREGGHKAVRGGSYATPADKIDVSRRGSQPPFFCTPFLGFRPVIAGQ